jgi:hypothetical protein
MTTLSWRPLSRPERGPNVFERIGIGTGRCQFCGGWGPVAVLESDVGRQDTNVEACEQCIRAAGKAAELLKVIRAGKAPKPKKAPSKARKPRTGPPKPIAPYSDEVDHERVQGDRELAEREL